MVRTAVNGNTAAIVELNSETDFVAASEPFKDLLESTFMVKTFLRNIITSHEFRIDSCNVHCNVFSSGIIMISLLLVNHLRTY